MLGRNLPAYRPKLRILLGSAFERGTGLRGVIAPMTRNQPDWLALHSLFGKEAQIPTLPSRCELVAIIAQAMREQAPDIYEELWATGALDRVLEWRASQAEDSYHDGLSRVMEARGETHQEIVAASFAARDEAARQAVNQATDFKGG